MALQHYYINFDMQAVKLAVIYLSLVLNTLIIDGCKFTSIAQTVTAEPMYGLHVSGITPLRKLKDFSHLIIRSI